MLRQIRRVALGASLALVVFANSAGAECAWVLWVGKGRVQPLDSFSTRSACVRALDDWQNQGNREQVPIIRLTETALDTEKQTFQCLPDTIDPRGPKGK